MSRIVLSALHIAATISLLAWSVAVVAAPRPGPAGTVDRNTGEQKALIGSQNNASAGTNGSMVDDCPFAAMLRNGQLRDQTRQHGVQNFKFEADIPRRPSIANDTSNVTHVERCSHRMLCRCDHQSMIFDEHAPGGFCSYSTGRETVDPRAAPGHVNIRDYIIDSTIVARHDINIYFNGYPGHHDWYGLVRNSQIYSCWDINYDVGNALPHRDGLCSITLVIDNCFLLFTLPRATGGIGSFNEFAH